MAGQAPLADGVRDILAEAIGEAVDINGLTRLTGGASRETWSVDACTESGDDLPVILRRDPPGHGEPKRMRAEVACLHAAARTGAPVPAVLASGDTAPAIDAPFILMERVSGEASPRRIQRDAEFGEVRPHLAEQMGRVLGHIHAADISDLGMLDDTDPVAAIEATYRAFDEPRPAVEIGLRWLRENRPALGPTRLVHGDFRLGNLLIKSDGLSAVLDWELAHLGDAVEDLGWLCVRAWRFGAEQPVGGLGTREQLLDGYEQVTGSRPSAAELHWWEIYGTLKWLVLSRFQAERHLGGNEHSIELAAIGRRVAESEYDVLLILDLIDDPAPAVEDHTYASPLHDRPGATEILDLVIETLTQQVAPSLQGAQQRENYLLRISANLLRIVDRELRAGTWTESAVHRMLSRLNFSSEEELALSVREGHVSLDDALVRQVVATAVLARLTVANPRYITRGA